MRRKIVVLDVDGVLIHPKGKNWKEGVERVLGVPAEHLSNHYFKKYWPDVVVGRSDMKQTLQGYLTDHRLSCTLEAIVTYWFESDGIRDQGVLATLDKYRGGFESVYLATNQEKHRAEFLWNRLELRDYADSMFYSGRLGVCKPQLEFFARVTEEIGASPADIFFFDDSAENVDGARAFGWRATRYRRGHTDFDDCLSAVSRES